MPISISIAPIATAWRAGQQFRPVSDLRRKRRWGHRKRSVAAGRGSGGYTYDIDPGKATSSILIFRMKSQDHGIMMPELGRSLVHSEAVTMLEAWIDQME
ncbi:MAG: hypothetical protein P1V13_24385 [Rhizobiaceae bacterium]|nr:hypothetical protein [Rhizobiaceae bacterium]